MNFRQTIELWRDTTCGVLSVVEFTSILVSLFVFLSIVIRLTFSLLVGSLSMVL